MKIRDTKIEGNMTNSQLDPNIVYEHGFSAEEISDKELKDFCNQIVFCSGDGENYPEKKLFQWSDRNELFKALKEISKTPTGRMSLRATMWYVQEQKKVDPGFKLKVVIGHDMSENDVKGKVLINNPDTIYLNPNAIKKEVKNHSDTKTVNPNAYYYFMGSVFLHEAQHTRQFSSGDAFFANGTYNFRLIDAAPQALTKQLAIESPYPEIQKGFKISQKEIQDYRNAVDYNPKTGEFDEQKASRYSTRMQQGYTLDFARSYEKRPFRNHTQLNAKWLYERSQLFFNLARPDAVPSSSYSEARYMKDTNRVQIDPKQKDSQFGVFCYRAVQKNYQAVLRNCPQEDRIYMAKLFQKDKNPKLDPKAFSSHKSYATAKRFVDQLNEMGQLFETISLASQQIHDNPNDKKALRDSDIARKILKEKYGIIISTKNQNNQTVAQTSSDKKTKPDLTSALAQTGATRVNPNSKSPSPNTNQNSYTA